MIYQIFTDSQLTELKKEISYSFSKSSGPGGQNVNKVATKVEMRFNIEKSLILSDLQKEKIRKEYKNQINQEDEWIIVNQESRSQLKNKALVEKRFFELLEKAFKEKKERKPTKPSKLAIEKRIKLKKSISDKKLMRGKIYF
jgi:ribosome-associated protein